MGYLWIMRSSEPQLSKKKILATLKKMPDELKLDDLFDRLLLMAKVERGLEEAKAGKGTSTTEARRQIKIGRNKVDSRLT